MNVVRVGQGFDIHRFSDDPERRLVLGGVVFEGSPGLHGHSDADVIAHAVADALLGAAALGDIGQHFPDTDPRWKDADSLALLAHVGILVRAAGWTIGNVDCSVVCEVPKLAPHRAENPGSAKRAVRMSPSRAGVPKGLALLGVARALPVGPLP